MSNTGQPVKGTRGNRTLTQDPRKLRRRRTAAGLGLNEAARQAQCSKAHLSMLEDGQHGASPPLLKRLAALYGCSIEDLMPAEHVSILPKGSAA